MSTRIDLSTLSLMDALDLAKLIEMEACHRYQMFANQLGRTGGYDAGAFFTSMVENEAKHGQELEERALFIFIGYATPHLVINPRLAGYELSVYDFDASLAAQSFCELGFLAEE